MPQPVAPKRSIHEVDYEDQDAVKRIRYKTFYSGATLNDCVEAYHKFHDVDPAVEFLIHQQEIKDAAKFRERIKAAAAKTLYEAAGLPEPNPDDEPAKPAWNFADDMDLDLDEVEEEKFEFNVEELIGLGRTYTEKGEMATTPAPEQSTGVAKYFTPYSNITRDVFGRVIPEFLPVQKISHEDKRAATFKAHAILAAAFKKHPQEAIRRWGTVNFKTFGTSNPLKFPTADCETLDRFGQTPLELTEAFPATTFNTSFGGTIFKLKSPTEDGASELCLANVSAVPMWSGKSGLHHMPDKHVKSVRLDTLSPEEIRLGDYYNHKFHSVAPHQFLRFLDLPLLVQSLIWEFSFEQRVVQIFYNPKFTRIWSPTKWPPQSLACKESNFVMRRVYERSPFGDATARRGLLINLDIDVVFLTFEKQEHLYGDGNGHIPFRESNQMRTAVKFLSSLPPAQLPKIRHLALDWSIWRKIAHDLASLRRRRHKVRGLDKYILPMLTGLTSLRIIENCNHGIWRVNKGRAAVEALACEGLVPRRCYAVDIGLDNDSVHCDLWEMLKEFDGLPGRDTSRWWNGSGVTYMQMVVPQVRVGWE